MMEATTMQTPLAAALGYAERGWRVFPVHSVRRQGTLCTCGRRDCGSPGKHPRTENGLKDATLDAGVIRAWWRRWPDAGVAIATGAGLVVIDVDPPKGGDDSLVDARRVLGDLPDTVEVITGSGGRHIYLSAPEGVTVRSSAGQLGPGLDIRGDGGYVVAPPSTHASGRRYAWEAMGDPDDVAVAAMPEGWLSRLTAPPRGARGGSTPAAEVFAEGTRNESLFRMARSLRAKGLDTDELEAALQVVNHRRCAPPLDTREVEAIARSACSVPAGLSPEVAREKASRDAEREHAAQRFRDRGAEAPAPQADADEGDVEREAIQNEPVGRRVFQRGDSIELAEALLEELDEGTGHPIVFDRGQFWRYQPQTGVFIELDRPVIYRRVSSYAGCLVAGRKPRALSLNHTAVNGVIDAASQLAASPGFFDGARKGVCFADCWATAQDGQVITEAHAPTHRATHAIDVPYAAGAWTAQWTAMLREIFRRERFDERGEVVGTDPEETQRAVELLQEFAGASLVGLATTYAVCLVLVGTGNDGKSRVLNVLRALFPATAVCAVAPNLWSRGFLLAELASKRLNVVSELPAGDVQEGERFKQVVAGDLLTAERKYEKPFALVPEAGHLFACNELPGTRDQSRGFWRRFAVIPCTRSFTAAEEVKDIDQRVIRAELAGIAAWALEGAARLQRVGRYTQPTVSETAKADWQNASDQVRQWVTAQCALIEKGAPTARSRTLEQLYQDYRSWAIANGHTPMASTKLGERLKGLGHEHRTNIARLYRLELNTEVAKRQRSFHDE